MDKQKQIIESDSRLKLFDGGRMRQRKPTTNHEVGGEKIVINLDEFTEVGHNEFVQLCATCLGNGSIPDAYCKSKPCPDCSVKK